MRVPRKTQAPLTRSGSRSTALQVDQLIMVLFYHGYYFKGLTGLTSLHSVLMVLMRSCASTGLGMCC
jgi:hypothetical protein